jgi:hypothetical protein
MCGLHDLQKTLGSPSSATHALPARARPFSTSPPIQTQHKDPGRIDSGAPLGAVPVPLPAVASGGQQQRERGPFRDLFNTHPPPWSSPRPLLPPSPRPHAPRVSRLLLRESRPHLMEGREGRPRLPVPSSSFGGRAADGGRGRSGRGGGGGPRRRRRGRASTRPTSGTRAVEALARWNSAAEQGCAREGEMRWRVAGDLSTPTRSRLLERGWWGGEEI